MTGEEMNEIRRRAALSHRQLAAFLYYNDLAGLREMERGKKPISGPIKRLLELIHDRRLDDMLERLFGPVEAGSRPSGYQGVGD